MRKKKQLTRSKSDFFITLIIIIVIVIIINIIYVIISVVQILTPYGAPQSTWNGLLLLLLLYLL